MFLEWKHESIVKILENPKNTVNNANKEIATSPEDNSSNEENVSETSGRVDYPFFNSTGTMSHSVNNASKEIATSPEDNSIINYSIINIICIIIVNNFFLTIK